MLGFQKKYALYFALLFGVEVCIALFVHDNFVRPYVGDALVVVVVYFFVKIFVIKEIKLLPLYVFLFAVAVEISQYFNLAQYVPFPPQRLWQIVLGSTFDVVDILCYGVGCIAIVGVEMLVKRNKGQP